MTTPTRIKTLTQELDSLRDRIELTLTKSLKGLVLKSEYDLVMDALRKADKQIKGMATREEYEKLGGDATCLSIEYDKLKASLTSTLELLKRLPHSPVCQSITARDIYQIGIGKCTCGLTAKINELEELVNE